MDAAGTVPLYDGGQLLLLQDALIGPRSGVLMKRGWDRFDSAWAWLKLTFVGGGAEARHTRQQQHQAVLRPAVREHASVVSQSRI